MTSGPYKLALSSTGYLDRDGRPVHGMMQPSDRGSARLRPVLEDDRIGLKADAVFSVQGTPTLIFKDAGKKAPSEKEVRGWHEAAWNLGVAPLLWIITPTEIKLYDCYASPPRRDGAAGTIPLESFALNAVDRLLALDSMCGRLATETGAFWSSEIGMRIDRRHRVDRELLGEIKALEERLTELPPARPSRLKGTAVVGNPPWTFDSRNTAQPRKPGDDDTARPRRSPDQAFLGVAARLAGNAGRIGMVMKATPFFSKDEHAVAARNAVLRRLQPIAMVNMSALRKEELFPDATGPALLFFARCALGSRVDQVLVGSLPWTPDFRRNGLFHVGPGELRAVPLARVLRTPAFLKAATFGTVRDGWLIERLEHEYPTLDSVLTRAGILPKASRGQGFQVAGATNKPPARYYELNVLTPGNYTPFRLIPTNLERFSHRTLHRTREPAIFRGPVVICPKASFKAAAQLGRYSTAVSAGDLLYTESFYGVSFADRNEIVAFALSALLNSSLTTFQLAFGGGAWGLERSTVEPKDLLSIRVPDLFGEEQASLTAMVEAEAAAASNPHDTRALSALDKTVFDFYGLEPDEALLAGESIERARMLIFEGHEERMRFIKPPALDMLGAYAGAVVRVVDRFLQAKGQRHLEATIYSRALVRASWAEGCPGLTAVRFTMASGKAVDAPIVRHSDGTELNDFAELLRDKLQSNIAPYLNERRLLRVYLEDDLFILKPSELRYWSQASGLNDADVILADHWLGDRHATHA